MDVSEPHHNHSKEWMSQEVPYVLDDEGYELWNHSYKNEREVVRVHQLLAIADGCDPHDVFDDDTVIHHGNNKNPRLPSTSIPWANWQGNVKVMERGEHISHHNTISTESLIKEIKRLNRKLGRVPGQKDMDEHGLFSQGPYYARFGGWNKALNLAGFNPPKSMNISKEELLSEIRKTVDMGYKPTRENVVECGEYSKEPYYREFGSWNNAVECAGIEPPRQTNISEEDLLNEICRLNNKLGQRPKLINMRMDGKYSGRPYRDRWGTWTNAVDEALSTS